MLQAGASFADANGSTTRAEKVPGMSKGEPAVDFKKGDIVQLKSGGPAMIVTGQNGETVQCLWYGEVTDEVKTGAIPSFCLVEAEIEEVDDR